MFLCYHWTRCGKFHHVRPHGFERPCPTAIFLPSIFCRSLSGTAGPLRRRKHLLEKTWKCSTGNVFLLLKPCHPVADIFWDAIGSFACLFDVFYYIFKSESWQIRQFSTEARTLKIINMPLTQKRHEIRDKRPLHEQNLTDKTGWI